MRTSKKMAAAFIVLLVMVFSLNTTAWAETTRTMYVGKTYKIENPGKYKWSSENKKIATVDNKKKTVTTLKAGTVYIKGVYKKKVKRIKVTTRDPKLTQTSCTITAGKSQKLSLKGTKATKWSSSNTKVATVSSTGLVRGKKTGSATITVTGKNKKKYTCKVTVRPAKTASSSKIYVIAHRGNENIAPENTMAAFRTAVASGYRSVETDIQFTKDGVPVLIHNPSINRTSNGKGRIADLTFEQVRQYDFGSWKNSRYAGEKIPSLQEFLEFCRNNGVHPYLELKNTSMMTRSNIEKVYNMVCDAGMQNNVSWFSFNYSYIEQLKEIAPTADIGVVLHSNESITKAVLTRVKNLKTGRNTVFICSRDRKNTPTIIANCKKAGIALVARDISAASDAKKLNSYYRSAIVL